MRLYKNETIAAIATAIGGGIGIIRISGDIAADIIHKIFVTKSHKPNFQLISHKFYYGHIVCKDNKIADEALAVVMYAPKSYTCEDVAEIHCHGGIQAVQKVLEIVLESGARLAEPGEFTKRAFLNGRIDLSQAEAVSDIIKAKSDAQHRSAVSRLSGKLSEKINEYKDLALNCLARIEAAIDYPEHEEEINTTTVGSVNNDIAGVLIEIIEKIEKLLVNYEAGRIMCEGINTVIIGKPNVGKSSLLNALLDEDRAIVTDIPGTTRDTLTEAVQLSNVILKITDTAGIRETGDIIEKIGVERSLNSLEQAELILAVLDGSQPLGSDDYEVLEKIKDKKYIIVVNKSDLGNILDYEKIQNYNHIIEISAKKSEGIEQLTGKIKELFMLGVIDNENYELLTNIRHKQLLITAKNQFQLAYDTAINGFSVDLISIDLQAAYESLCEIIGDNASEDLIDRIFSEFCLGK